MLFHLRLAHDLIEKGTWLKLTGEKVQSLEQSEAWKPVLPRQSCQRLLCGPVITVLNLKYKFLEKNPAFGAVSLCLNDIFGKDQRGFLGKRCTLVASTHFVFNQVLNFLYPCQTGSNLQHAVSR